MLVRIFSDDIVEWRNGDPVWTVAGKVPLLTIGCPDVRVSAYAGLPGATSLPIARTAWVLDSITRQNSSES